jgi:hypothetical protein
MTTRLYRALPVGRLHYSRFFAAASKYTASYGLQAGRYSTAAVSCKESLTPLASQLQGQIKVSLYLNHVEQSSLTNHRQLVHFL